VQNHFKHAAVGVLCLVGLGFAVGADACSTDAWQGGVVGGSANSPPTIPRYSELCGFQLDNAQGHVQDNNATSDARYRARFYVLDGLTGAGAIDIFEAYADNGATNPLFKVAFDGSQFTFDATDAGGGSASVASANGWNLVEFDWDSGTNTFSYWVNADALSDPANGDVNAGTGTVEAVRLGAPNGFASQTGKLTYDAFESRRTTPIGALLAGDGNNDGNVNSGDIISVINEFFNSNNLASGQPDCNGDGNVNSGDIICIINTFFGG
jgi:hypothetical protein